MKPQRVCVLGGTGFVGHHLVYALCAAGYACRVPTRRPQRHRDLRLVPGCELVEIEGFGSGNLAATLGGCTALINLTGILNETGGRTFQSTHVDLVDEALRAAKSAGVKRYLHMSALHADAERGPSEYLRSKGRGEALAQRGAELGIAVTSFRPSVIFGRGDNLFNRFARLLRTLPGPFPLACAQSRFAPVYVGDVVQAMLSGLGSPATAGQAYELCGPRVLTLREIVEYTARLLGRKVRVMPLDERLSRLQAQVLQRLPGKLFSLDNYLSLQVDSVCGSDGLGALGIRATPIEAVVPGYLGPRSVAVAR